MDEIENEQIVGESLFNAGCPNLDKIISDRDEFGLPKMSNLKGRQVVDKGSDRNSGDNDAGVRFAERPQPDFINGILKKPSGVNPKNPPPFASTSGTKDSDGFVIEDTEGVGTPKTSSPGLRSWSNILKSPPPSNPEVKFNYFPLAPGSSIVSPPDGVLMKGLEKMKCCIVGTFTKKYLPYRAVCEAAKTVWEKFGLLKVSQKDHKTYIFKFNTVAGKSAALARGTWYLDNKPMVVCEWGKKLEDKITNMPIWFRLSNVPECYWTEYGLGSLASVIGKPLCADNPTSQLDIMLFAKMCVDYKVGDELPEKITAVAIDAHGEKFTSQVTVSYISKPLVCTGCKNIGHLVSACPITKRVWVRKVRPPSTVSEQPEHTILQTDPISTPSVETVANLSDAPLVNEGWTEVKCKSIKSSFSAVQPSEDQAETSPPPPTLFKKLKVVDEIDKIVGAPHMSKQSHPGSGKKSKKMVKASSSSHKT